MLDGLTDCELSTLLEVAKHGRIARSGVAHNLEVMQLIYYSENAIAYFLTSEGYAVVRKLHEDKEAQGHWNRTELKIS